MACSRKSSRSAERGGFPLRGSVVEAATAAGPPFGHGVRMGIGEIDPPVPLGAPVLVVPVAALARRVGTAFQRQHRRRGGKVAPAFPRSRFRATPRPGLDADGVVRVGDAPVLDRAAGTADLRADPSAHEPVREVEHLPRLRVSGPDSYSPLQLLSNSGCLCHATASCTHPPGRRTAAVRRRPPAACDTPPVQPRAWRRARHPAPGLPWSEPAASRRR